MNLRSLGGLLGLALLSCSGTGGSDHSPPFVLVPRWANQQRVPTASHLRAVRFNTATQGFIAGHDTSLYRTDDGGITWFQAEHQPFNRGGDIVGLDFLGQEVQAVGVDGNFGRHWSSVDTVNWTTPDLDMTLAKFVSVDVTADLVNPALNLTWALREDWTLRISNSSGAFVESSNPDLPLPSDPLKATAIDMLFSGPGYVVGKGGLIFETQDRNGNWIERMGAGSNNLNDVQCVEAGVVFACGENGTLVWTENGGDLAALVAGGAPAPTGTLRGLQFIHTFQGTSTGWVVGDGGLVRKVTGVFTPGAPGTWAWTWAPAPASVTSEPLYDVHFVDLNNGYAVGDNGVVIKTTNGGAVWTNLTAGSTDTINAVSFDPTGVIGVAVGDNGKVYKTLNGGSFWLTTPVGATNWTGVSIPPGNPNVAYICGPGGQIRRNLNLAASNTWSQAPDADGELVGKTFRAILFPSSADVGIVVGDGSTILWTSAGTGAFEWEPPLNPAVPASDYKCLTSNFQGGGMELYAGGTNGVIAESTMTNYPVAWSSLASGVPATWGAGETVTAIRSPLSTMLFAALDDNSGQRLHRRLVGSWALGASQPSPTTPPTPEGLAFVGQSLGWWVSDKIYTTQNGANSGVGLNDWQVSPTHTKSTFKGIWMDQSGTIGYVVGTNGAILKTVTGGK